MPGGRLANVGVSGAFGTLSVGQMWSASDNHAGGILDNTQYYGDDKMTGRVGSALSYAFASGPMSMQADAIFNEGAPAAGMVDANNDADEDIQEFQFGLTVQIGEIGKIALSYIDDKYTLDPGADTLFGMKKALMQKGTLNSNPLPKYIDLDGNGTIDVAELMADGSGANNHIDSLDSQLTAANLLVNEGVTVVANRKAVTVAEVGKTVTNRYKLGGYIVDHTVTTPSATTTDDTTTTDVDESQATHSYTFYDAKTGAKLDNMEDGMDDTAWSTKTTALGLQFSLADVSIYTGVAKKKSSYEGHPHVASGATAMPDKETDTTFFGLSGGLGDTGVGYHFHWRDEDNAKPWVLGLTKSLGADALLVLEHHNADDSVAADGTTNKNATNLGLHVNF